MSTRAVYNIQGKSFYIHHDGYPEFAVVYLAKMIDFYSREDSNSGLPEAFLRANERASFHDGSFVGQEFEYNVDFDKKGFIQVSYNTVDSSNGNRGTKKTMELSVLVEKYKKHFEPIPVLVYTPSAYSSRINIRYISAPSRDARVQRLTARVGEYAVKGMIDSGNASSVLSDLNQLRTAAIGKPLDLKKLDGVA